MKIVFSVSIIVILLIALKMPALAVWDIPTDAAQASTFIIEQPNPAWTSAVAPSPEIVMEAQAAAASTVVEASGDWIDRSAIPADQPGFVKSAEDLEILNQQVITPEMLAMGIVPEPGSIAGLSAGLFGLIFQARRMRRKMKNEK